MQYLERAALAGAATGLRSTSAVAALIIAQAPGLPGPLTRPVAAWAAGLGVTAELGLDKLPSTPSRLEPSGLVGRIVMASVAGAVLARGTGHAVLPAVIVASAAALVSARVGHDVRAAVEERIVPSAVAAVEDAVALSLAAASAHTRDS
jgi:uncharacterized membrane protein